MTTLNVASLCVLLAQLRLFLGRMQLQSYLGHGGDGLGILSTVYRVMMKRGRFDDAITNF